LFLATVDGRWGRVTGNEQALKLLKSSTKNDHLRVNVNGTKQGEEIMVKSIFLCFSMTYSAERVLTIDTRPGREEAGGGAARRTPKRNLHLLYSPICRFPHL
jgi:hypothetical protein